MFDFVAHCCVGRGKGSKPIWQRQSFGEMLGICAGIRMARTAFANALYTIFICSLAHFMRKDNMPVAPRVVASAHHPVFIAPSSAASALSSEASAPGSEVVRPSTDPFALSSVVVRPTKTVSASGAEASAQSKTATASASAIVRPSSVASARRAKGF